MGFTGLVQAVGTAFFNPTTYILSVSATREYWSGCQKGDSIATNGCCLTLLDEVDSDIAQFFVMEETLARTNLANIENSGIRVNLEKALQHGDRLGGHLVSGHVDVVAPVVDIVRNTDTSIDLWIESPSLEYCVHKGSIAINGVSLTIASLEQAREASLKTNSSRASIDSGKLRICVIPHTQEHTNIGSLKIGDYVNIEYDQVLKHLNTKHNIPVDEYWMRRAIELGARGRCTSYPNPWVGCVIVSKDNTMLGEGWHVQAGSPHAEVRAIEDANTDLSEATVYVTLEPCNHTGRTPPCTQLLIKCGVKRVVIGIQDPDTKVSGNGIKCLRDANIDVVVGVLENEVTQSLKPYIHHRTTGMPWVVLKLGTTLDGKITLPSASWITCKESVQDVHVRWRATSQAIVVGSRTATIDRPKLTVREWPLDTDLDLVKQPLRVILGNYTPTDDLTPASLKSMLVLPNDGDLIGVLKKLGNLGCLQVLVEGGSKIATSFLQENLVNRLVIYQSPILSGSEGISWYCGATVDKWKLDSVQQFGSDVCLEYKNSN